jgi:hypothetical protein
MVTSMLGGAAPVVLRRAQSRVGQPLPFHAPRHLILYTVSCVLVAGKCPPGQFAAVGEGPDFHLLARPATATRADLVSAAAPLRRPGAPPVREHRGGLLDGGGDVAG